MGRKGINTPTESEAAERAFGDYVAMGPARSLEALWRSYAGVAGAPTHRLRTLKEWSSRHRWQARMSAAATERVERLLQEASEIDAGTFLETSRMLASIAPKLDAMPADLVKVRESVRRKGPDVSVSVNVEVELRAMAERAAAAAGLDADDVLAEAQRILAGSGFGG